MPVGPKQTLRFGRFELDPHCGQLRTDGSSLKLQGQPIQILEILLEKPGELVTRDELRERLWSSDTFVDFEHSLNTAVKKLRQALGDDPDAPRYIETVPTRGYRLICEVDRQQAVESIVSAGETSAVIELAVVKAKRPRRRYWAIVAIMAVMVIAVALLVLKSPRLPRIVRSHVLTETGFRKTRGQSRLITDGTSLYFQEDRPSGMTTMQVRLGGGKISELSTVHGALRDISKDGSELLLSVPQGNPAEYFGGGSVQYDAWGQPLPDGPARLVVGDARFPLWSPDNRDIYFLRNGDKDLYRSNSDGTKARRIATFSDITALTLSPNGSGLRFVIGVAGPLWEIAVDGSNSHPVITNHPSPVLPGTWSDDGKLFFFLSWDDDRYDLWVVPDHQHWWEFNPRPVQLTFGPLSIASPAISKEGKQIYAIGMERRGELSVFDSASDEWVPYLGGISASWLDFSRDGQWVAYVAYPQGTLWRSRIDGTERRQLTAPPMAVISPKWSPDGKSIAFNHVSTADRLHREKCSIYVISRDGGSPLLLVSEDESANSPTWSPDGSSIAYGVGGRKELRVFNLKTRTSSKLTGSDGYWEPNWSPDGDYLLAQSGMSPTDTVLYSFADRHWAVLSQNVRWGKWSPDSKFFYGLHENSLVRLSLSGRKLERVASLPLIPSTAYLYDRWGVGWFGVTPDGHALTTRDVGREEIYAFDLEYK